jgi:ferredoxin
MAENGECRVWIDQDLCTGDGLCEEIAPKVFTLMDDGLAYVREDGHVYDGTNPNFPKGSRGLARIPEGMLEAALEASDECPGECIFVQDANGQNLGRYEP